MDVFGFGMRALLVPEESEEELPSEPESEDEVELWLFMLFLLWLLFLPTTSIFFALFDCAS